MSSHVAKRSVIVSIISGTCIAAFKMIAGLISGSSAMISEAIHSCVDASNSFFLLIGERARGRPADATHPFGHGREVYFWTLIVAVSIFAGGGAMSIYHGVDSLLHAAPLAPSVWSYVVLGVALVFEAWTIASAYREVRQVRRNDGLGLWQAFRRSSDLTTFVILFENGAAVLGVVIAAVGITASQMTGSPIPDGIASLLIGALLVMVALVLIRESKGLIVGEGLDSRDTGDMRALVATNPNVEEVLNLMTLHTGPGEVLVVMDLRFAPLLTAARLVEVIDDVESGLRARYPEVTRIFVEADRIVETQRDLMPGGAATGVLSPARGPA